MAHILKQYWLTLQGDESKQIVTVETVNRLKAPSRVTHLIKTV